jgi:hypothetical protein
LEPTPPSPNSSDVSGPTPQRKRGVIWAAILIAGLLLILIIAFLAARSGKIFVRPDWARQLGLPTATQPCVQPALLLGHASFPLEALARAGDRLPLPPGKAGVAGWVADTFAPYVFLLVQASTNPDLQATLKPGDPMVVQWADCGREEYIFSSRLPGTPDAEDWLAQTAAGIVVIVQPPGGTPAYALRGERPAMAQPETPEPTDENAIQADITFGDTIVSEDGQTLTTALTITNRGSQAITITPNDLWLTVEGEEPLAPLSVEPALPQEIQPGDSQSLTIIFPNPGGNVATLKLLDFSMDLYY